MKKTKKKSKIVLADHTDYIKYMFEGINSMDELGDRLITIGNEFKEISKKGGELSCPIDSGHIVYTIADHFLEVNDSDDSDDYDSMCKICYKITKA